MQSIELYGRLRTYIIIIIVGVVVVVDSNVFIVLESWIQTMDLRRERVDVPLHLIDSTLSSMCAVPRRAIFWTVSRDFVSVFL